MAVDSAGNVYIGDANNNVVRMIDTSGTISTYAGGGSNGTATFTGSPTAAILSTPYGLTYSAAGDLYIADAGHNIIRTIH